MEASKLDLEVWVLDDEIEIAQIYANVLKPYYPTRVFHHAKEVLAAIERGPESHFILLSDIKMPDLDGIELSNKLCNAKYTPPTILMTGLVIDAELIRKTAHLPLAGILDKPFKADELLALVKKAESMLSSDLSQQRLLKLYLTRTILQDKLLKLYQMRFELAERTLKRPPQISPQDLQKQKFYETAIQEIAKQIDTIDSAQS